MKSEQTRRYALDRKYQTLVCAKHGSFTQSSARRLLAVTLTALLAVAAALHGHAQIYVANANSGTVGKYTTSGAVINRSLIAGLPIANGLALGGDGFLYVANKGYGDGKVGKYTLSGGVVNASLITSVSSPTGLTSDGQGNLYLANNDNGRVGKYTTSGATVNASLITGLFNPDGLAFDGLGNLFVMDSNTIKKYTTGGSLLNGNFISASSPFGIAFDGNGHIFVPEQGYGKISMYDISGNLLNPSLISGLSFPTAVAYEGGNLYVTEFNNGNGRISKFTAAGAVIDANLITGLQAPTALIVVPEPTTFTLLGLGSLALVMVRRRYTKA